MEMVRNRTHQCPSFSAFKSVGSFIFNTQTKELGVVILRTAVLYCTIGVPRRAIYILLHGSNSSQ